MKQKNTVIAGIIVSAFLTTLVLFQWIDYMITAFLILGGCLTCTFYVALSQARGGKMVEKDLLLESIQRLQEQEQEMALVEQLLHRSTSLVTNEFSFYYQIENQVLVGEVQDVGFWAATCALLASERRTIRWPAQDLSYFTPGPGVQNFIAFPVHTAQRLHGIMVLANRKVAQDFSEADQALLQILVHQSEMVLQRFSKQRQKESFYSDIISYLIKGSEGKRTGFKGHSQRVGALAGLLGTRLGLTAKEQEALNMAALLHDCGKLTTLGEAILNENEDDSQGRTEAHPQRGAEFFPAQERFALIKQGILYHHERYNGSGYPEGLSYTQIPFIASIIAVADIFDALTNLGEVEQRLSRTAAFKEMKKEIGTLFDPLVIVALEELMPVILEENK